MKIKESVTVNTTRAAAWTVICDIDNAEQHISAIEKAVVLERPDNGIVGLKWEETRVMFGQASTEIMWMTEAVEGEYYKTHSESHGMVYTSCMSLHGDDGNITISLEFGGKSQTMKAKILGTLMAPMITRMVRKAVRQDLLDLKRVLEQSA